MTFGDFKNLQFDDRLPMELVLSICLYQGRIDINEVLTAYTRALEQERIESKMRFEEACVTMSMKLCGNFTGKHEEVNKRMIHIYNKTKTLAKNVFNSKYGYTKEDEQHFDELCKNIYGDINL